MMKHEQIEAAIERLRKISYGARKYNALEAVEAVIPDGSWVDGLIDLLEQADPDTNMKLPKDADGEYIHIGDEVCGYNHPNGGVYCHAIVNPCVIAVGELRHMGDSNGWALWNTLDVRHYHKPTVEDVLHEFATVIFAAGIFPTDDNDKFTQEKIVEYAEKIREAME